MYCNNDNFTVKSFWIMCKNAQEILKEYNVPKEDEAIRNFLRENIKSDDYGHGHPFYIIKLNDSLITVDEHMKDIVMLFNKNGFPTVFSCQGGKKQDAYISFSEFLTETQRRELYAFAMHLMRMGLRVSVDSGWINSGSRPVVRFSSVKTAAENPRRHLPNMPDETSAMNKLAFYAALLFLKEEDHAEFMDAMIAISNFEDRM